jgi:hypothetical protein
MSCFGLPAWAITETKVTPLHGLEERAENLAAFVVHVSVAEAWIRLTRRSGVPGTRAAKAT